MRAVNLRRIAIPFEAADYRGARDLELLAFLDDGFVERLTAIAVPLGEEQTQRGRP
jgi:hypothetical protein